MLATDCTILRPSRRRERARQDQQPDEQKNTQGQQIDPLNVNDTRFYQCINRKDEQPFDVAKTTNGTNDGNKKTWLDNFEKPCEQGSKYRRCHGDRADQCVRSASKFLTLNENNGPGK